MFYDLPKLRVFGGHSGTDSGIDQLLDWPIIKHDQKILLLFPGGALPNHDREKMGLALEEDMFLRKINGRRLPDFFFKRNLIDEQRTRLDFWKNAFCKTSASDAFILLAVPEDLNLSLELVKRINEDPINCHIPELETVINAFLDRYNILEHPERLQCFGCSAGTALIHYVGLCAERRLRAEGKQDCEIFSWGRKVKALAICPVVLDWHDKIAAATGRDADLLAPPLFETSMYFDPRDGHAAFFHSLRLSQPEVLETAPLLVRMLRRNSPSWLIHTAQHDEGEKYHYHDPRCFLKDAVMPGQKQRVFTKKQERHMVAGPNKGEYRI